MVLVLCVLLSAGLCMAQTYPPNPDFSTDDLRAYDTWAKPGHECTITWDATQGAAAPGCLHAVATGSGHSEAGFYLRIPSQLFGGKELEIHCRARLSGIAQVPVAFWYPGSSVSPAWHHAGVIAASGDEWVDCGTDDGAIVKMVEPASDFGVMNLAFYLFKDPGSDREMWLDDIQLIADGVDMTPSVAVAPRPLPVNDASATIGATPARIYTLRGRAVAPRRHPGAPLQIAPGAVARQCLLTPWGEAVVPRFYGSRPAPAAR